MTTIHDPTRRLLVTLVVAGAATIFVVANRHDLPAAARALRDVQPGWLAVASATAVVYLAVYGLARAAALSSFSVALPLRRALLTGLVAHAVNIVAKTGGMGAAAVYREEARRTGRSPARVLGGVMLSVLLGDLAFASVLLVSFAVLVADGRFTTTDAIASVVFAGYLLLVLSAVIAAARSRGAVRWLFALPARVRHRPSDPTHADELFDAVQQLRARPAAALPTMGWMFAIEALGVALLWECLRAYGQRTGLGVPLAGYSISVLFSIVGVLPAGIGFAEASLGAVLVGFSVPVAVAAVVVITYRMFEVWIPLLVGLAVMRHWRRNGASPTPSID
jgi:uncharacterized membrane protein YbhN (UPF0104 family)